MKTFRVHRNGSYAAWAADAAGFICRSIPDGFCGINEGMNSQQILDRLRENEHGLPVAPVRPALDAATERAARVFMQRIEGKYPAIEGLVYGSRARGDHRADSDADIAVILKGERGDRYKVSGDMAGIAFDVMLETGILVQALPLWEAELRQPERFSNPALIENIKRDGLRL